MKYKYVCRFFLSFILFYKIFDNNSVSEIQQVARFDASVLKMLNALFAIIVGGEKVGNM